MLCALTGWKTTDSKNTDKRNTTVERHTLAVLGSTSHHRVLQRNGARLLVDPVLRQLELRGRRGITPGITSPPPCWRVASYVFRPRSTVSNSPMSAPKSMSGSMTIQSLSPLGPAMYPSRLMATE